MLWQRIRERWHKDGWLLAALAGVVILCLWLSGVEQTTTRSREEARLEQVLSAMEGAGTVEVVLYYEATADGQTAAVPSGAVLVADGAADIGVRLRLTRAVTALTGLQASRVEVFERKGGTSHGQLAP
ncbi:MAG: hypothetical protein ACI4MJ_01730 [Aristaeellaceae bacterium]